MSKEAQSSGIGFGGLLTVLFVGLKLAHVINWSWWWVLAPMWLPFVIVCLIVLGGAALYMLAELFR